MKLSDFDYELPSELIAKYPLKERSASRLLCLNGQTGQITHKHFKDILSLVTDKDLLVFNNTRVIKARLFGQKATGGQVEMLVERILDQHRVLAHVRASKSPKPESILTFTDANGQQIQFKMLGRHHDLFELRCEDGRPVLEVIEQWGEIPLPPYFHRSPEESDLERYQTVYAEHKGSVAAPTAGLHFDIEIMNQLKQKGVGVGFVTLHVGSGTFAPVRVEDITQHRMHAEFIDVSEELCEQIRQTKARGGRIIAVGTTSARSLESASQNGTAIPFHGDTDIFIYPGYQFKCVDVLITNFHLPGSTLLMLVATMRGYESIMRAYKIAIEHQYRFFSYGDAMWISKKE
jgi:S-adenosylmethionine:tRNA ribosyltransferase-isomerase